MKIAMGIDREGFAQEMGLPDEVVQDLYQVFADELSGDLDALRESVRNADGIGYARMVHKIKGTSASYRAMVLHTLVEAADEKAKREQWKEAFLLMSEIDRAGQDTITEISTWTECEA
jgi:HPt (histidine-containing phosphotransfer) domain-containing protein